MPDVPHRAAHRSYPKRTYAPSNDSVFFEDALVPRFEKLAHEILAGGAITAADVITLRQGFFEDGIVDRDEAELVFYLDAHSSGNDAEWNAFFVDALTSYFVWQQVPRGMLGDEDGQFLIARVTHDGRIDHDSEFQLVVNIIIKAWLCPEDVIVLALETVEANVLDSSGKLFGKGRRRPGIIDESEVDVLRAIVYGTGGGGGLTVTRREAELMFRLNNKTVERKNASGWRDLFVTAVGCYLMHPKAPPDIDVEEILRRDKSLAMMARGEGPSIISQMMNTNPFEHLAEEGRKEKARLQRDRDNLAAELEREAVDEKEIEWLIARITEDDMIHDNERALLAFIKEKGADNHPSLDPYFEKYGV